MTTPNYRAWHEGDNVMVDCRRGLSTSPDGTLQWQYYNREGTVVSAPLMQSVGLQGLYEGDIIQDSVGIGRIEYSDQWGAFRVNYENGRCKWFIDYLDYELTGIQVVGNIYETPDKPLGEH